MTHGSLFSGIGGFDLAAEWMGWENKFHCEWDGFCQTVLKHYWPDAKSYGDIDNTDFTIWRGLIDVLSGGFPCQPYSQAGKRKAFSKWRNESIKTFGNAVVPQVVYELYKVIDLISKQPTI